MYSSVMQEGGARALAETSQVEAHLLDHDQSCHHFVDLLRNHSSHIRIPHSVDALVLVIVGIADALSEDSCSSETAELIAISWVIAKS